MTTELTTDELLEQLWAEFEAKKATIEATKARYQAEMAAHAQLLEVEQRRIERAAEKREAREALELYLIAWRDRFTEQADAAAAWVAKMAEYVEILKRVSSGQQFIQSQAQAMLSDFARGLKAFVKAFDNEAEMKEAAYGLAEQLTAEISWNLPASAALRTEFGIRNADWRNQFGDLRRQAIDRGLKAQPAPAPTAPALEVSAQTQALNADCSVTVHDGFVDSDAPVTSQPTKPAEWDHQPQPVRRRQRK